MASEASVSQFQVGRFIDSKDTAGNWCAARILSYNPDRRAFLVRYDGWSEKWDATISTWSAKLAPFRKYSKLYTGQKKTAIREWTFSTEEVEKTRAAIEALTNLSGGDAYETTQLLRVAE